MPNQVITRFAPSPTGDLHLGHAYSALIAHEYSLRHEGSFLLRFEDIDTTRCRDVYYRSIEEDLKWLGIEWAPSPTKQSERFEHYQEALSRLKALGVLYPCFCTRKEMELSAPHQGDPSKYAGACRALSEEQRDEMRAAGRGYSWRLNMQKAAQLTGELSFFDEQLGQVRVQPEVLGDVVLARKDIQTSYHLAVVVDDADQEITHVIRGEDLVESTHVHRILQELLELPVPQYHHHRLITDSAGARLAKRDRVQSLQVLREQGVTPHQVREMLSLDDH